MPDLDRLDEYQAPYQKLSEELKRHMEELVLRLEQVFGPWLDWAECMALARIIAEHRIRWDDGFQASSDGPDMSNTHASRVALCFHNGKEGRGNPRQLKLDMMAMSDRQYPKALNHMKDMLDKLQYYHGVSVEVPPYGDDPDAP